MAQGHFIWGHQKFAFGTENTFTIVDIGERTRTRTVLPSDDSKTT